ncbi:ATP-binding protein [Paracidovorax avenae]|uniref:ATP-binding protein n=1 Tax=Paracidovorax avenae TaxID=80867 RepID=UPI0006B324E2|nr:ATP-binding protein [Paracidovorax avenae]
MNAWNGSYQLQTLHLYNWGAFGGRHQAGIDAANTAVIGPTGSGKTTLIDALMTLLCANPRYNLASTGGHESDRDLVSYVRGATGPGHAGDDSDHLARTGRCTTAVAARLARCSGEGGAGEDSVLIGGIFWFDGSSSSVSDMGRRWFFAQGPGHDLDLWLEEHHSGGARALGRLEKNTDGLDIFTSKTAYLARLQRFFEVGPNAFTLLNRAAGLKQLNSIDEIFRELVLDDQSAYDDALQVAASFDELATIHAELELAHRQYLALLPLRTLAQQEQEQRRRMDGLRRLQAALPRWFAGEGHGLWRQRAHALDAGLAALQGRMAQAGATLEQARADERERLQKYLLSGGSSIDLLRRNITVQRQELARRRQALADYRTLARHLNLPWAAGAGATTARLTEHQGLAAQALADLEEQQAAHTAAAEEAVARERNAHAELAQLQAEEKAVRQRPGSNLPAAFQTFRTLLADALHLPPEDLPFVAELVEVRKDQQAWRGAIERALGSQRLRILVPRQAMHDALDWVNRRHNQLHVRLLEVREASDGPGRPAAPFWSDGFCGKLNLKPHRHQHALREVLHDIDRHCVDDVKALRTTPHAMTQQGLMSGKARHFDKQDQKRLDHDWMTGFDNRDRLAHLARQIAEASQRWSDRQAEKQAAQEALAQAAARQHLWRTLLALRFEDLDIERPQADLERDESQLAALLDPTSDTAQAEQQWEAAKAATMDADEALRALERQHAGLHEQHSQAMQKQADFAARLAELPADAPPLTEELAKLLSGGLPALDCDQLERQERTALADLQKQLDKQAGLSAELHKEIIRQMGKALKEDRGALTDQPDELAALPHYLERLRVLEEEALPEKRQRFQEYLNDASDQGVNTLLNGIEAQVAEITDRIDQLNQTLQRVDFQPGRFLQLDPQPVIHQSLQALNKAMALLRTERLRDDGGHGHYQALRAMVELLREHATNRRTKAAQALLDARYRLQFAVHVMDRANGQILERRTGSQGGSGGEKEIIASYVLTASLSYALCPPGRTRPLFGSIVLDEAFSKSSQAVAARIIQALREFGLHALFVTPNKELRLLRSHTRSAVVVHRRGRQASLVCLSWEELDAHARQRQGGRPPP